MSEKKICKENTLHGVMMGANGPEVVTMDVGYPINELPDFLIKPDVEIEKNKQMTGKPILFFDGKHFEKIKVCYLCE